MCKQTNKPNMCWVRRETKQNGGKKHGLRIVPIMIIIIRLAKVKRKSKGKRKKKKKKKKENVCADLSSCRQSKPAERLSTTLIRFRLFPYLDFSRQVTRVPRTSFKSGTLIYVPSPSPPSLSLFLSPHDQVHHPLCELYVHTDRRTKKEG